MIKGAKPKYNRLHEQYGVMLLLAIASISLVVMAFSIDQYMKVISGISIHTFYPFAYENGLEGFTDHLDHLGFSHLSLLFFAGISLWQKRNWLTILTLGLAIAIWFF
ncbi:hypothetical protein GCM10007049_12080 [Echinicola pacifica]|uniref:Uncharacterized protein n=1 Tax=Echinicola pacifica TaxID=346377 RepID=A0A918PRX8_9BACT|nr:hypothetical protein [Echinicola pacifica]GGZ21033.1 hypothetical protein GCM10007049_12080 [Echinicola pacifica]